ncbi:MAG: hypothetical protein AB1374_11185 [Bacillota bacterium]
MQVPIPKSILIAMNQLYEIEQKLKKQEHPLNLQRNVNKIKDAFSEEGLPFFDAMGNKSSVGFVYEDPMGQSFNETRTDLEATIAGTGTECLVVVEVIKPIIRMVLQGGPGEFQRVVQKGVVVVESRKESGDHEQHD